MIYLRHSKYKTPLLIGAGLLLLVGLAINAGWINQETEPKTVVAFGDSLVEGVGSSRGGGFASMLSMELDTPIANLGKSGDTTADAIARLDIVTALNPDVVILLLGGNDYLSGVSAERIYENLKTIIEHLQNAGSEVILVGLDSNAPGRSYSQYFENLAEEKGVAYVPDILKGIYGNPTLMSDSLHPNDAGYALIAERILPALEDILD